MRKETKLRTLGKPTFERPKPQFTLVQSVEHPLSSKAEMSPEVKEMLREMSRRRAVAEGSNAAGAA